MSTQSTHETKVAVFDGFFGGKRIRKGETFVAPKKEKARWFRSADGADVTDDLGSTASILDGQAKDIVAALSGQTDEELSALISAEQAGKNRKGVLAAIEDERANRIGRVGGPEPKAKKPQETDPKVPGAEPGPGDELLK